MTAPERPTFAGLEKRVGLDHLRPDFRTSSHLVHAGSSGTLLVETLFRGGDVLLAGPTNNGLAQPMHGAAISLVQITTVLVNRGRVAEFHPIVLAMLQALLIFVDELGEKGMEAERRLDRLESQYQVAAQRGTLAVWLLGWRNRLRRTLWRLHRAGHRLRAELRLPRWVARLPRARGGSARPRLN